MEEHWGYDVYLSERVRELLEEGTLEQVLKLVEADLKDELFKTPTDASNTRELIYHEVHALNRVQLKLHAILASMRRG